jgi:hypothetical protein
VTAQIIHETIVTSGWPAEQAHITPLGLRRIEGRVLLSPFRPSTTLERVREARCAVVNYTDDVRVFAGCMVGRRDWPLAPATRVNALRLAESLAHEELELVQFEDDVSRPKLWLRTVHTETHAPFRGFNRAQAAVIEASVLVSRLHLLPASKVDAELAYLSIAIERTGGPHEREAWGWLLEAIAAHRVREAPLRTPGSTR